MCHVPFSTLDETESDDWRVSGASDPLSPVLVGAEGHTKQPREASGLIMSVKYTAGKIHLLVNIAHPPFQATAKRKKQYEYECVVSARV